MADLHPGEANDVGHPRARKLRHVTATALVALLGLAAAAGITYAASRLVSQPIGLSSEPQRIGDSLGPPPEQTTTTTQTDDRTTTQPTTTSTTTPADDDSHGRRSEHGDGDHDADD